MPKDLRQFLETVEARAPDLLRRVRRAVSPRWEVSALQKRLEAAGRVPILLFETLEGHDLRLVTNLFASKRHLALALDTTPEQVVARFAEAQARRIPPRAV